MGASIVDVITKNYWVLIFGLLAFSVLLVLFVWCIKTWRTGARYDYLTLQDEHSHDEVERKAARKASVDASMTIGKYCLQGTTRYRIIATYPEMGTRPDRHWFLVNDSIIKTDRLMTITRISDKSPLLQLNDDEDAQKAIFELFLALQHPFIQPVLDINYKPVKEQMYAVIVFPFNKAGSLKDLIYNTRCQDTFAGKNNTCSAKPLDVAQIRTFGRQILEAILFLQDYREFPPIGEHLHSGNVIVQDGVARLTGYENILLGLRSKSHPTLRKKLKSHPESIDTISFGHIIFEMCTGSQLDTLHPSFKQLDTIHKRYDEVIQVLKFIFNMNEDFPKLEEVAALNLFRHIDLREMRSLPGPTLLKPKFSATVHKLMKQVWKQQRKRSCRKKEMEENLISEKMHIPTSPPQEYIYQTRYRRSMPAEIPEYTRDVSDEDIFHSPPLHLLPIHSSFSADDCIFKYTMEYPPTEFEEVPPYQSRHHLQLPHLNELSNHNYISSSVPSGMYRTDHWNWSSQEKDEPSDIETDEYYRNRKWTCNYDSDGFISPEYFSLDTVSLVECDTVMASSHRKSPIRKFNGTSV